MKIIKRANSKTILADVTPFNMSAVEDMTHDMLEKARTEAAAIVKQAEEKAVSIEQKARLIMKETEDSADDVRRKSEEEGSQKGRAEGYEQGKKDAFVDMTEVLKERLKEDIGYFSNLIETLQSRYDGLFRQAERDLLKLAVAIAERIVKKHVETDPEMAARALAEILGQLAEGTQLKVSLHPDDLAKMTESMPEVVAQASGVKVLAINGDSDLERGACAVDVAHGDIVFTPSAQIDAISRMLLGVGVDDAI